MAATVIRNEDDAWRLLKRALKEENFAVDGIKFDGWPNLDIHLEGKDLHATLPSRYLPALIEYQEALERVFTYVQYKEKNLRRLKDHEREDLQIVYSLEEGSTGIFSQCAEALDRISQATDKMTGKQIAITVCVLALLYSSSSAWSQWLDHKEAIAKTSAQDRLVTQIVEDSAEKTKLLERMQLLDDATKSSTYGKSVLKSVDEAHSKLVNSMADDDLLYIGEQKVAGRDIKEAISKGRQKTKPYSHQGPARLLSVDSSLMKGYVIGVHMEDGGVFNARIESNRLTPEELECVKEAIFSRQPIWVHIEGKLQGNKTVKDAYIHSARELSNVESKRLLAAK